MADGGGDDTIDGGSGADELVFLDTDFGAVTDGSVGGNSVLLTGSFGVFDIQDVELFVFADQTFTLVQLSNALEDLGCTGGGGDLVVDPDTAGTGTLEDDEFSGTNDADALSGHAGNDLILGLDGNDTIEGGICFDSVYGGEGNDSLVGNNGYDYLFGEAGNDTLIGNNGFDTLYGEGGDDLFFGGISPDALHGGDGADTIYGQAGFDTLFGGDGNDVMNGNAGADLVSGGPGNDTLNGDLASDTFVFTGGHDIIQDFQNNNDSIVIDGDLLSLVHLGSNIVTIEDLRGLFEVEGENIIGTFGAGNTLEILGLSNFNAFLDDMTIESIDYTY